MSRNEWFAMLKREEKERRSFDGVVSRVEATLSNQQRTNGHVTRQS